jgi:hypothetical protein
LSYKTWLYKKADESAHNEILAFLMVILGMNLLIGGLLVTINSIRDQSILAFFNQAPFTNFSMIGSILTVVGFAIALVGFALIIHYDRQKSWYYSEIEKSTMYKKGKTKYKTIDEVLE